jgi:tripartite-type tricarboxylate transporter receptor subunit TctC
MPHIKAGTLRALAVGTETRAPSLPDVPTMAETLPGFVTTVWFAVVAPPRTPPEIADKLSAAMVDILKQANVVAKLKGMDVQPLGSSAGEMSKFVAQEAERWGKIIRSAKIAIE